MSDLQTLRMYMPIKARNVLGRPSRYKVLWGGRGSGKSYAFGQVAIARALHQPIRVLCARETQNSIRDSVHRLLCDIIYTNRLDPFFTIRQESIQSKCGAEFIFKGLHHNISEIKSMQGIDVCWVEEAEKVTEDSWDMLIPTIRAEGSEIWISFNPEDAKSPTYRRFVVNAPPDCLSEHMIFSDNKFFPDVLKRDMEWMREVDYEKYEWVYLGKLKKYAEDLIFRGKIETDLDFVGPEDVQRYQGLDFGFANDPQSFHQMYILDDYLWIEWEAYGRGVELEETEAFLDSVPNARKWRITADSARPETISFLANKGFNIVGAEKGKGSVEDGISFLKGFKGIKIHRRCTGAKQDYENYRWKRDRITGEILPIPVDKSNHTIDDNRYALESYVKGNVSIYDVLR